MKELFLAIEMVFMGIYELFLAKVVLEIIDHCWENEKAYLSVTEKCYKLNWKMYKKVCFSNLPDQTKYETMKVLGDAMEDIHKIIIGLRMDAQGLG